MTGKSKNPKKLPSLDAPNFSGWEEWSGEIFHKKLQDARKYYYEEFDKMDLIKYVWTWMEQNGYTSEQIKYAHAATASVRPCGVVGINCRLLLDGLPDYNQKYADYYNQLPGYSSELKPLSSVLRGLIDAAIVDGIDRYKELEPEVEIKHRNPQDTILETVKTSAIEIDEWLSNSSNNGWKPNQFEFRAFFEKYKFTATHAKRLESFYIDEFARLEKLVKPKDKKNMSQEEIDELDQLREGYSNYTKSQLTKYYQALCLIMQECQAFINTKKAIKSVNKKITPKNIETQVSKLKYLANDTTHNLTSINPRTIIGAEILWIYNTKTRKLGRYVASKIDPNGMRRPGSGLSVKGSAIVDFDPELSIQKTVRKPAETLLEFNAANKIKLRTFLDDLSTIDTRMNGRITSETILLRVF